MSAGPFSRSLRVLGSGLRAWAALGRVRLGRIWSPEADRHFVWNVRSREREFDQLDVDGLEWRLVAGRAALLREGAAGAALVDALALICVRLRRAADLHVADAQLMAVRAVLLHRIACLDPGEGKSLAALLAAAALAWSGQAVRIRVASDALAQRSLVRAQALLSPLALQAALLELHPVGEDRSSCRLPGQTVHFCGPQADPRAAAGGWMLLDDVVEPASRSAAGALLMGGFATGPLPRSWMPGLPAIRMPSPRTRLLRRLPSRLFPSGAARRGAVLSRVMDLVEEGRPVLVAVDSLAEAQTLSRILAEAYVDHQVLTACLPEQALEQLPAAGGLAAVTLATGPVVLAEELPLAPGVVERGGLHLLDCQRGALHALAQWEHCVARRGEPGSVERWFSLDDARVASRLPAALARALAWHWPGERPLEAATLMPWAMEVLARRVSAWRHPARHCADA